MGGLQYWSRFDYGIRLRDIVLVFLLGVRINQNLDKKIEEHDAKNRAVIDHNEKLIGLEMARKNEIKRQKLEKLGIGDL